jgi:hypothetical protein
VPGNQLLLFFFLRAGRRFNDGRYRVSAARVGDCLIEEAHRRFVASSAEFKGIKVGENSAVAIIAMLAMPSQSGGESNSRMS